jgi:hypothetical protein
MRYFLHWSCRSAINMLWSQIPRLTKPVTVEIDRGRGIGEAASPWAGAAFTDHGGDVGRWDRFVHKGQRKVAVMLHLGPPREQAAGRLETRQFASVIAECKPTGGTVDETILLRG